MLLESSIVYQNVEPSQFIDRLLHRITAEIRIAHVTRNQQALASFSFDGVAGLFRIALLFFQVDDGHISTLTRIENGYGPADAGISAGNQSNSVFELVCAFITGSFVPGTRLDFGFQSRMLLVLLRKWRFGFSLRRLGLFRERHEFAFLLLFGSAFLLGSRTLCSHCSSC